MRDPIHTLVEKTVYTETRDFDADHVKGFKCPIACGQCCEYWRDVPELTVLKGDVCPYEGKNSCRLARHQRPSACVEYLCDTAIAVIKKQISRAEGLTLKINCKEYK